MQQQEQQETKVVMGVDLAKVDEKRLKQYMRETGIKFGPKDDAEKLVKNVMMKMSDDSQRDPEKFLLCDACNGISPNDVTCPFCGEVDAAADETAAEDRSQNVLTSEEKEAPKRNGLAKLNGHSNGAAMVPHKAPTPKAHLKGLLDETREFVRNWQNTAWDIGDRLIRLSQETSDAPALWKLLKAEDGVQQRHKSFAAFTKAEFGLSEEMTRTCLYAAKEYSREQLLGFTVSKLSIVLNAPESQQKKLLEKAGTKTAAELRASVKELNIKEGKKLKAEGKKDPREKRTAARQDRAKRENAAKDASKGVTTFVLDGSKATAKLWRESKDAHGKLTPASSVTDAWGWIDGKNGVQLVFKLEKTADGKLKVRFEAKRDTGE